MINKDSALNFLSAIFVWFLLIDPGDISHIKTPLFILLLLFCALFYPRIWGKSVSVVFTLYLVLLTTSIIGFLCEYNTDTQMIIFYYKTFLMLILIAWANKLKVLEQLYFPGMIMSIFVFIVYIICINSPQTMIEMASDYTSHNLIIGYRTFLGVEFVSVYYSSCSIFLLLLPITLSNFLHKRSLETFLISLFISALLICSGLRAIACSAVAIILITYLIFLWEKKHRILTIILLTGVLISGVIFAYMLLNDTGEPSLDVKTQLAYAFKTHIKNNPETLIWGNGFGATFDSLGVRGKEATESELFYYEIVRFLGIPLGIIFLLIYIYPAILIYRRRHDLQYWKFILLGYFFYLLAGGTNPYLTGSNAMLTLLTLYSYALNPYYRKRAIHENINSYSLV